MALTANPDPVQKNPATGSSQWFLIVGHLLLLAKIAHKQTVDKLESLASAINYYFG